MKRKEFYTFYKRYEVTGAKKETGFEITIENMKFYVYKDELCGYFYVIDSKTGKSIMKIDTLKAGEIEEQDVRDVREELKRKRWILERFKERRETEEYKIMAKIFSYYRRGKKLEEQL